VVNCEYALNQQIPLIDHKFFLLTIVCLLLSRTKLRSFLFIWNENLKPNAVKVYFNSSWGEKVNKFNEFSASRVATFGLKQWFPNCQNFPFPNWQNFLFKTVKSFLSKLSKNFPFKTVKSFLFKLSKVFFLNCQKFSFLKLSKISFLNCQNFPFQTVKSFIFKLSKIFLFKTVKISLSKLSKFPFPNCQKFPFKTVKISFSNCQNFSVHPKFHTKIGAMAKFFQFIRKPQNWIK
jgi:hypothetical protein